MRTLSKLVGYSVMLIGAYACSPTGGGDDDPSAQSVNPNTPAPSATATSAGGGETFDPGEPILDDPVSERVDPDCPPLVVGFEEINPTVVLLIDRSGSMWDFSYGGSPTRWEALFEALMAPDTSPIRALEDKVRWGFTAYTNDGHDEQTTECPILNKVGIQFGNYETIRAEYERLNVTGKPPFKPETPTGDSVRIVADELAAYREPGPKFIVLATDGEPDDCRTSDPQCGQDLSIKAVQDAYTRGIRTFVIGIGNDVGQKHLRDLANAGNGEPVAAPDNDFVNTCINGGHAERTASYVSQGQAPGNATYYQPTDPAALETAIRSIVRSVRECQFTLEAEVDLEAAHEGNVVLDGVALVYDDPNGWSMIDNRTVEVVGASCEKILTDGRVLSITFPCGVAEPIQ